jgi:hypothetical protein
MLAKRWINRLRKKCPRTLQVGYRKHMQQPLSEMSHTHRDFFGSIAPPSLTRTPASTDKNCYNYVERGHFTYQCPLALSCLGNPTLTESNRRTLEDELTM